MRGSSTTGPDGIDDSIGRLVDCLNAIDGITTFGSCGGHPGGTGRNGGDGYHVPYVAFTAAPEAVAGLRRRLAQVATRVAWVVEPFPVVANGYVLTAVREGAFDLAGAWFDAGRLAGALA